MNNNIIVLTGVTGQDGSHMVDFLLKETDYLALSDTTLPEPMRVYRQELRDIPQDFATPDIVIFPNKPDE